MSNLKSQEILPKSLNIMRKCFFIRENNKAHASIGQPAVLHCTVHMSHDVHVRVLHVSHDVHVRVLHGDMDNSGIPGGDAETRD